ncbi:MAG: hypothetical protein ACQETB_04565 [Halobacteriota archaeon]
MGDKHFTFLELHLDGERLQFGPERIGDTLLPGGSDDTDETAPGEHSESESETGGCSGRSALAVLAAVVVIAIGIAIGMKLLGERPADELLELDDE